MHRAIPRIPHVQATTETLWTRGTLIDIATHRDTGRGMGAETVHDLEGRGNLDRDGGRKMYHLDRSTPQWSGTATRLRLHNRDLRTTNSPSVCYGEAHLFPLYSAFAFAVLTPPEWVCRESKP